MFPSLTRINVWASFWMSSTYNLDLDFGKIILMMSLFKIVQKPPRKLIKIQPKHCLELDCCTAFPELLIFCPTLELHNSQMTSPIWMILESKLIYKCSSTNLGSHLGETVLETAWKLALKTGENKQNPFFSFLCLQLLFWWSGSIAFPWYFWPCE